MTLFDDVAMTLGILNGYDIKLMITVVVVNCSARTLRNLIKSVASFKNTFHVIKNLSADNSKKASNNKKN